ncbi:ester cyclase [Candidatus Poribacteria bacterium]
MLARKVSILLACLILTCLNGIPQIHADIEQNKALVRLVVEEVWNKGNLDIVDEILSTDWANHDPDYPEVSSIDSYKQNAARARAEFPDMRMTIDDISAEGDKVTVRWIMAGYAEGY